MRCVAGGGRSKIASTHVMAAHEAVSVALRAVQQALVLS